MATLTAPKKAVKTVMTKKQLLEQASLKGIKVTSKMSKAELEKEVNVKSQASEDPNPFPGEY